MGNIQTGNKGEDLACKYLQKQGYKILERNFRIRGGEIDIVAKDKEIIAFIEVKTRYSHKYGLPIEAITPWKIKALIRSAEIYITKKGWQDKSIRMDFLGIDYTDNLPKIELIKNIIES